MYSNKSILILFIDSIWIHRIMSQEYCLKKSDETDITREIPTKVI